MRAARRARVLARDQPEPWRRRVRECPRQSRTCSRAAPRSAALPARRRAARAPVPPPRRAPANSEAMLAARERRVHVRALDEPPVFLDVLRVLRGRALGLHVLLAILGEFHVELRVVEPRRTFLRALSRFV